MPITSLKYSFVQFGQSEDQNICCNGANSISLPVVNQSDLYFQVISDSAPSTLEVVNMNGDVISTQSGFVDAGNGVYSWQNNIDISGLACDECFQLRIGSDLSNVFVKKCDDCFTSLLEYSNEEDYADFIYCNAAFVNRVRLPLFLSKPKMNEDRSVYRKSNGFIKLTKSLLTKEYQATTDYMPEQMHDALSVALAHDTINITSNEYSGSISKSGEYNIGWEDGMCVAPADFKVAVTPFAIRNNNCQECIPIAPCVAVTVPSFTLPDANVGSAYNQTITLGGTSPITLSAIVKPGWMTVAISGNVVTFSGTPAGGDEGTGITVSFDATNDCGTDSGSTTIDVTAITCTPVSIVGTPVLPDAYIDTGYSYSFAVTGTAPFTLTSITKPSWMTIAVSGSDIVFSGTPTSTATGITISFTINNCTSDTVDFSDTIDVANPVAVGGTIVAAPRDVIVNISQALACDVTFGIQGISDEGGTPTGFSCSVTILAGNTSGSATDVVAGIITCIQPTTAGQTVYVYSTYVCAGIRYIFTLDIDTPC